MSVAFRGRAHALFACALLWMSDARALAAGEAAAPGLGTASQPAAPPPAAASTPAADAVSAPVPAPVQDPSAAASPASPTSSSLGDAPVSPPPEVEPAKPLFIPQVEVVGRAPRALENIPGTA